MFPNLQLDMINQMKPFYSLKLSGGYLECPKQ